MDTHTHTHTQYCAVCHKVIRDLEKENKILKCHACDLWVHARCDGLDELGLISKSLRILFIVALYGKCTRALTFSNVPWPLMS